ncbi:MAG: DUF2760 domain-containing protein [Bryobacterales bacterium]|nr:DUF2760 domain-containing protein [Bryobacterales bacterium]
MGRIILAFRSFFAILFSGSLPDDAAAALGLSRKPAKPAPKPGPERGPADGAMQILGILQRDARLVDFLMEDIGGYTDDQVGAAVRELHAQCRETLDRYARVEPVIDGVEGTFTRAPEGDGSAVKWMGNVPPKPPEGGTLRHRGWRCVRLELPQLGAKQKPDILAPAELEVE